MNGYAMVTVLREVEATQIPSGQKIILEQNSQVQIVQALGGSYTVMTDMGYMARISNENADALGKEVKKIKIVDEQGQMRPVEDLIWDQLKTCYDPEIPVNIVDLGLIYECKLYDLENGQKRVDIKMTLTAPGCGMGEVLRIDVIEKIKQLPHIQEVNVELVWQPQWDRTMMSDAAKLKLGMI